MVKEEERDISYEMREEKIGDLIALTSIPAQYKVDIGSQFHIQFSVAHKVE